MFLRDGFSRDVFFTARLLRDGLTKFGLVCLALFMLSACQSSSDGDNAPPPTPMNVDISISSTAGLPMEDVVIETRWKQGKTAIPEASGQTNSKGLATLENVPSESKVVFVFEKTGYAAQVKVLETPTADVATSIDVVMIKQAEPQAFAADEAAELNGQDGAYVAVDAGSFVDSSGQPVSGNIELQMTPVDVSTEAGLAAFPGSFSGIPEDGSGESSIVSFGTTEYTFTQNGEALQLADGETAIIDMPMYIDTYPDGTSVEIGDEIPLWYLDEDSGIWVQEGVGEVIAKPSSPVGLAMRAEVSHFTWWNTDWYPQEQERFDINISILAQDETNVVTEALNGGYLQMRISAPGWSGIGRAKIGETKQQEIFAGNWCLQAYGNLTLEDGSLVYVETNQVCEFFTGPTNVDLFFDISGIEFTVINQLRSTATENSDYGACNDKPKISAKSPYPVTYTIVSGALPPGMQLQENGSVTGTPTMRGQYNVQIEVAENINGERGEWEYLIQDITVAPELSIRAPSTYPVMQIGYDTNFLSPFTADGGLEDYEYRLSPDGSVPPGITFDTEDTDLQGTPGRVLVNGSPMMVYRSKVEVEVRDQNCALATDHYDQDTIWTPRLEGEPEPAVVGEAFSFTLTNTEGPIDSWELIRGLPAWASLNTVTGEVTGTPTRSDFGIESEVTIFAQGPEIEQLRGLRGEGGHTFTLRVEMNEPEVANLNDDFIVAVGQAFSFTPVNTGGEADRWEADNLPSWLTLDTSTGAINGTPANVATHDDIVLRAVNPAGSSDTGAFSIQVVAQVAAPQLTGTPNNAEVGVTYNFTVGNNGGVANTWNLSGTLPTGLQFSNGSISGTPSVAGTFTNLDITGTNAGGTDTLSVSLTVDKGQQAALRFTDIGPISKLSSDTSFINLAQGGSGTGAITYQSSDTQVATVDNTSGSVTIVSNGQTTISATKAEDANYLATSTSYVLNVNAERVILGDPDIAYRGQGYTFEPSVVNGITIDTWSISSGSLPTLTFLNAETGVIAGIPQAVGTSTFDLQALSDSGIVYRRSFQINVVEPPQAPNLWNDDNFALCSSFGEVGCVLELALGNEFSQTLNPGTPDAVTWSISGDLPTGISFDDGQFSGTSNDSGDFFVNITATNQVGSDTLGFFFSLKQAQDPITFEDSGPVNKLISDQPFTNAASGGNTASAIVYRSSDTSIATVNSQTGEVTLLLPGSVDISATRSGDSTYQSVSESYRLTITLVAPDITYSYHQITSTMAGDLSNFNLHHDAITSVVSSTPYASLSSPVDPDDSNTLSGAGTSTIGTLQTDNDGQLYYLATQVTSSNDLSSALSEERRALTLNKGQAITGDNGTAFGQQVAIAGDVMVISNSLNDAYASKQDVSVYERIDDVWTLTQKIPARQDWWGNALDVHQANDGSYRIAIGSNASSNFGNVDRQGGLGTYIKVTADICGNEVDDNSNGQIDEVDCETVADGTLYNNGIWLLENYHEGIYPYALDLGDERLLVGLPDSDNCESGFFSCGEVQVYRFAPGGGWSAVVDQTITAPQQQTMNFHFGRTLASEADIIVIAAPGADLSNCFNNCAVHVYQDNGQSVSELGRLGGLGNMQARQYGYSLAISGNTIAVGDPTAAIAGGPTNGDGGDGKVYLFQKDETDSWTDDQSPTELVAPAASVNTPAMNFGQSLAFDGDRLIVGDNTVGCRDDKTNCGAIHLLDPDEDGQYRQDNIMSHHAYYPDQAENDGFGFRLAADNKQLLVIKREDDASMSAGKAVIYNLP